MLAGLARKYEVRMIKVETDLSECLDRVRARDQRDHIPISDEKVNDGYTTVNLAMDYQISDSWKIWGKVENLFDEEYTVSGYEAPGRSFYGGIRLDL